LAVINALISQRQTRTRLLTWLQKACRISNDGRQIRIECASQMIAAVPPRLADIGKCFADPFRFDWRQSVETFEREPSFCGLCSSSDPASRPNCWAKPCTSLLQRLASQNTEPTSPPAKKAKGSGPRNWQMSVPILVIFLVGSTTNCEGVRTPGNYPAGKNRHLP
jgi:hypothetical protein